MRMRAQRMARDAAEAGETDTQAKTNALPCSAQTKPMLQRLLRAPEQRASRRRVELHESKILPGLPTCPGKREGETTVTDEKILQALKRLRVETGSLAYLGCGREHNCGTHGCAILRQAADLIERLTARGEMMKGTSNFDKLCHQVYNADGNGRDYIGKATGVTCRLCKSPLYAYYCEERLYLVECKTCEMKALVKAENPQVAACRAFGSEVK